MTVSVIGTGNLGSRVARRLAEGGVEVVVAADNLSNAEAVAQGIGKGVRAVEVADAIAAGDEVILVTRFPTTRELLGQYQAQLAGKVVIDPSNNIAPDESGGVRSLNPDGVSAGRQLAALIPPGAKYVKAFGTLPADLLDSTATDTGETPMLFYASDDGEAGAVAADLITKAGFDAVRAGGIEATGRIEVFGDLHPLGGLNGRLVARDEALQLVKG